MNRLELEQLARAEFVVVSPQGLSGQCFETFIELPLNYQDRLIVIKKDKINKTKSLCLEIHDLAYSKLAEGRRRDFDFLINLLMNKMIKLGRLKKLIDKECSDLNLKEFLIDNFATVEAKLYRSQKIKSVRKAL